jgi:hypothetical protein
VEGEVKKELRIARKHKKEIRVFVDEPLRGDSQQLIFQLDVRVRLDLGGYQLTYFTTSQDLIRKVTSTIPFTRAQ